APPPARLSTLLAQLTAAGPAHQRRLPIPVGSCARGSPQLEVDDVTGLPLVYCDKYLDVRIIALTTKAVTSQFYGQRFFKCPRNKKGDSSSCPNYYLKDEYEAYLRRNGLLMGEPTHGQHEHLIAGCDLLEQKDSVEKQVQEVKKELEDYWPWACIQLSCPWFVTFLL
ncbi:hypothetical protein BS78_10G014700, partial [Paspalum vaginatum]